MSNIETAVTDYPATAFGPDYIRKTDYVGKWQIVKRSAPTGARTAGWLAEYIGAGNELIIWDYSGQTRGGGHLLTRNRYVATTDGHLNGYDSNGRLTIRKPADRMVRFYAA